jgi:hypothetical protein
LQTSCCLNPCGFHRRHDSLLVEVDGVDSPPDPIRLACSRLCANQEEAAVITGGSKGVIPQRSGSTATADNGAGSRGR